MVLVLSFGALALVVLAGVLTLWQVVQERAKRHATQAYMEQQLGRFDGDTPSPQPAMKMQPLFGPRALTSLMLRAGIASSARFYVIRSLLIVVPALAALLLGGPLAGAAALLLAALASYFQLWLRATRRQEKMVRQLPGFLDSVVRLIIVGNSIDAAFQTASASGVEMPLQEAVQRAASLNRSGMELEAALRTVAQQYALRELFLAAAVIGLANRFGGRSDQVLDRMAAFMRDLQQARQELVAMSAEVRLSAWILSLLPIGLGCFMIVFNNDLFMNMWTDGTGRKMLACAALLQIVGSFWLYRLGKSL